jgi:hypothetical protein
MVLLDLLCKIFVVDAETVEIFAAHPIPPWFLLLGQHDRKQTRCQKSPGYATFLFADVNDAGVKYAFVV